MVEVSSFDAAAERYAALWRACDADSFFRSPAHLRYIADITQCELHLVCLRGGQGTDAVLPFAVKRGPLGAVINGLPYFGSYGGVVGDSSPDNVQMLVSRLFDYAQSINAVSTTLVDDWRRPCFDGVVASHLTTSRTNQVTWLTPSSDGELQRRFHYKTRNMVRKAVKAGVAVRRSIAASDLHGLQAVHRENMRALGGAGKPTAFFDLLESSPTALGRMQIYVAEHETSAAAYLLNFYCGDTVEYYMPAVVERYRSMQPLSLLIDHALRDALADGYRVWNWGGTWLSQESLRRFKIRWGSQETRYLYHTWIHQPSILRVSPAELSVDYPYFFVVPFEALTS